MRRLNLDIDRAITKGISLIDDPTATALYGKSATLSAARRKSINDLLEARNIHYQWSQVPEGKHHFPGYGIEWHKEIMAEKDVALNAIINKIENDPESLRLVNKWLQAHVDWKNRVTTEPSLSYKAGDVEWQNRWINSYGEMIKQLKDKNLAIALSIVGPTSLGMMFAPDEAEAMSMKPLRDVITKGGGGRAASVASKAEHPIFIRTKGVGEFDERYLYDLPNLKTAIDTTDTSALLEAYRSGNVKRVVQRYDGTDYSSYHPDEDLRKAFLKQPEIIQKRLFDIARKNVKKEMGGRWDVSPIDKKVIDESGDALYFAMNLAELADNPKSFLTSTAGIDVIPPTKRIGPVFKSLAAPVAIGAAGAMMPFEVGAAERPVPMTATGIVGRMGPQAPLGMEMESRREYGRKWEGGGLKEAINPAEYLIPARWGGGAINMAVDALLNQILGE